MVNLALTVSGVPCQTSMFRHDAQRTPFSQLSAAPLRLDPDRQTYLGDPDSIPMNLEEEVVEVHGLGRITVPGLGVLRNIYEAAETDMLATFQYVEPTSDNLSVYSVQLWRLLQDACNGLDSAFNLWYDVLKVGAEEKPTIVDYYPLLGRLCRDENKALSVKRGAGYVIAPFQGWDGERGIPGWWTAHNKTKHGLDRVTFREANLSNALHALGALYLVLNDRYSVAGKRGPMGTRVFVPVF